MSIDSLDKVPLIQQPVVLSIGNFDGVHLGHQTLIHRMKQLREQEQGKTALVTFNNHPSEILRPYHKAALLTSSEHKVALLQKFGIDYVLLLTFDQDFAKQTADQFLQRLRDAIPFRHLVLGYDAKLGKERQGDKEELERMGRLLGFTVEIVPPFLIHGKPVSSTEIRKALQTDDLKTVAAMLGRKYSILATVKAGSGHGKTLGYPTANCDVQGLALPSLGVYAVSILFQGQKFYGVANLGFAPTLQTKHEPLLEVYVFDQNISLYGKTIEVVFEEFIRQEIRFPSAQELKQQIAQDVEAAVRILDKCL